MFWFRLRASFIGRRVPLWIAGGCAWIALGVLLAAGRLDWGAPGFVAMNTLMFGVFYANRHRRHGFAAVLDIFPGAAIGAALIVLALAWNEPDPALGTTLAFGGSLFGSMVWNFLPIVPRISAAQLAHVAQRLGDEAMVQGAPVTHIEAQHDRPLFEQDSVRMDARGPVTLYEEPRWNRIRAMCERPTLLPVHPAEDMAAIFPDGVAWRLPTSAHARLAHAARVADSQARSIFRLL